MDIDGDYGCVQGLSEDIFGSWYNGMVAIKDTFIHDSRYINVYMVLLHDGFSLSVVI